MFERSIFAHSIVIFLYDSPKVINTIKSGDAAIRRATITALMIYCIFISKLAPK